MSESIRISVVLGCYNRLELLKLTLQSVRDELAGFPHEIIVIDGGSQDGSLEWLIQQKDIVTIVQHNHGEWDGRKLDKQPWGYFMNLGFKAARGKYVCMISDDCILVPGAIKNGYQLFEQELQAGKKIGAMAFYYRDWPRKMEYRVANNLDQMYVNHGLYLKKALEKVGYADEENFEFYYCDTDLVLKMIHNGYQCISSPTSFVEHFYYDSLKRKDKSVEKRDLENLLQKWKGIQFEEKDIERYRESAGFSSFIAGGFEDDHKVAERFKPFLKSYGVSGPAKVLKKISRLFTGESE